MSVKLSAHLIENFQGVFLSPALDNAAATPPFHREVWSLYCSDVLFAGAAAPRGHAKTTAFTQTFGMACALFRFEPHIMIISSSEELAMGLLGDITKALKENDDLRAEFGIVKFLVESKGEIIVRCDDGYEFRILARGVEQRVRGIKWNGRRPGLILGDDMEEDEQVENAARRKKLTRWVNRALIPMGRKGCRVRIHGTILHQDSMLAKIMKSKEWKTLFYKAHNSFSDFGNILWPEMWNEGSLRTKRQFYIDDGDPAGYSQEYLNDPQDEATAFLKKEQFRPMDGDDFEIEKVMGCGVDFAISKADSANRTSFTVGGQDVRNIVCVTDVRVGRMDSSEIVEEFFSIYDRWKPDWYWVESGQIWLSVQPSIQREMFRRGKFLNITAFTPVKDKKARGLPYQKRMKAGAIHFDKDASWYEEFEEENLKFTGESEAKLDDQFDSTALLIKGFESMPDLEPEDFETEDEVDMRRNDPRRLAGRNATTGY